MSQYKSAFVKKLQGTIRAVALASFACAVPFVSASEIELRAAVFVPVNTKWSKPFEMFAEKVNQSGVVKLRLIGPEALPAAEQPNALRSGMVDILVTPPGTYKSAMVEVNAQDLSNMTLAEQRASGGYDALNNLLVKRLNAFALTTYGTGVPFHLFLNKEIKTKEDLKGLRARTQPIHVPFFTSLGMSSATVAVPEVYTALERNVVQGYGFGLWGIEDFGWDEMTKTRIEPGFYNVVINVMVNDRKWKSLTAEQQQTLKDAVIWFEQELLTYTEQENARTKALHDERGIKAVDLGPEFAQQAADVYWAELERLSPINIPKLKALLVK
jgi:TRAP-type C4-dicarboxylate transport system substrate-binding protein